MRKFLIKIFIIATITVIILFIRIFILNFNNFKKNSIRYLPLNNISNSQCFRAKIDHLVRSDNFKNCTFLIAGSSMSLNNISGSAIRNRTKEYVYNISSWNFRPNQLLECLRLFDTGKIKYILVAFNNCDFGKSGFEIDYKNLGCYLNQKKIKQVWSCIKKFNINTFSDDCDYRNKFSSINNAYESLNFDEYGSVLFEKKGFIINKNKWNEINDTIGFNKFLNNINDLHSFCEYHKINLILVYLPSRPNLLKNINLIQNYKVSEILQSKFRKSFFDLQKVKIPSNYYCDGIHMFKEGAQIITNSILDTLNKK